MIFDNRHLVVRLNKFKLFFFERNINQKIALRGDGNFFKPRKDRFLGLDEIDENEFQAVNGLFQGKGHRQHFLIG